MAISKKVLLLSISIVVIAHNTHATLVFTYENPEATVINKADFSLTSNVIDDTLTQSQSDFAASNKISPQRSTAQQPPEKEISPEDSYAYTKYYENILQQPTDKKQLSDVNMNLYSGSAFQLKYQPSDFTIIDEVFKGDPQLDRLSRYFIDNAEISPGQIMVLNGKTTATFLIGRQNQVGYRMPIISGSLYSITCPEGKTKFDVSELNRLPTYEINSDTKGCTIVYLGTSSIPKK